MRVTPVDTDIVGLATDPAEYRVRFWGSEVGQGFARSLEEWRVCDESDSRSVVEWAAANSRGRDFEVFAALVGPEGTVFARIAGLDGDADTGITVTVTFSDGN